MAALIGLARLKERIADALEIIRPDADAVVGDAQHEIRSIDFGGHRDGAAPLGEFDRVGDKIDDDLLEGPQIAIDVRQCLRRARDQIDAVLLLILVNISIYFSCYFILKLLVLQGSLCIPSLYHFQLEFGNHHFPNDRFLKHLLLIVWNPPVLRLSN